MAAAGNVVLAETVTFPATPPGDLLVADQVFPPVAAFAAAAAGVGHANTFPDTDGVVRALPPVVELPDGSLQSSLSFTLAQLALGSIGADHRATRCGPGRGAASSPPATYTFSS